MSLAPPQEELGKLAGPLDSEAGSSLWSILLSRWCFPVAVVPAAGFLRAVTSGPEGQRVAQLCWEGGLAILIKTAGICFEHREGD